MTETAPYEVADNADDERFYVLAVSAESAIERVKLELSDPDGARAWKAVLASRALVLTDNIVFDSSGRHVKKSIT